MPRGFILILFLSFGAGISLAQGPPPLLIGSKEFRKRILTKDRFSEVPPKVRDLHAKGTINVLLHIDADGKVEKTFMLSGFKHIDYMRQYIEAEVAGWRFKPLNRQGEFVPYRGIVSITFCYGGFPRKGGC